MSEQGAEVVELQLGTDAGFAGLMDALVADDQAQQAAAEAGSGTAETPPATDAAVGAAAAGGEPAAGAGAADAGAGAVPGADVLDAGEGKPSGSDDAVVPDGAGAGGAATDAPADRPGTGAADAGELIPKLGELNTAFETRVRQVHQTEALEALQSEHPAYFTALQQHPRLLVGREVPAVGKEGMETLRDEADATSWQAAMKQVLIDEINTRADKAMEDQRDFLTTVHASIDLFKNNPDLIPGTKAFDADLANRLTQLLEPYELRVDEKLQGYSIDVQPFVNQLRTTLVAERAAAASSAATPPVAAATPPAPAAAAPPAAAASPTDQPQAGIASKAGQGSDGEDFSTLFGTLGLPGLRI